MTAQDKERHDAAIQAMSKAMDKIPIPGTADEEVRQSIDRRLVSLKNNREIGRMAAIDAAFDLGKSCQELKSSQAQPAADAMLAQRDDEPSVYLKDSESDNDRNAFK